MPKSRINTLLLAYSIIVSILAIFLSIRVMHLGKVIDLNQNTTKLEIKDLQNSPSLGSLEARMTFVLFINYQCPHCQEAFDLITNFHKKYPDKVAVVIKHRPTNTHNDVYSPEAYAYAAKRQEKFWQIQPYLFGDTVNQAELLSIATDLEMDIDLLLKDINNKEFLTQVEDDVRLANRLGVTSLPGIFLNGVKVPQISESIITKLEKSL